MRTIKQIADEFKVSKQAISKFLTPEFRENHVSTEPTNHGQQIIIDEDGYNLIKGHYEDNYDSQPTLNEGPTSRERLVGSEVASLLKKQIDSQNKEIRKKNKQLGKKDKQIFELHKLLDQSQQLQLMAEKKIAALEAPKETETPAQPAKDETDSEAVTEGTKKEPRPQKQGFWHRIFK